MKSAQMSLEKLSACPVCGSEEFEDWLEGPDRLHGLSGALVFKYARCSDCEVFFQQVRPKRSEIAGMYPEEYAPHQGRSKKKRKREWQLFKDEFGGRLRSGL